MFSIVVLAALVFAVDRPLILAHVMPWFEKGGWHWKMNATLKPDRVASHFSPLIGAYDSLDRKVVELHVQWMKIAGIDGIIADWYGTHNWYDYPVIHKRTQLLFEVAEQAGLKVCVMYEDQTIKNAIAGGFADPIQSSTYAAKDGAWLKPWVKRASWLKLKGKPVVFVFGPQYLEKDGWQAFLSAADYPVLLSEHKQVESAGGAFDWPLPAQGLKFTFDFTSRANRWGIKVATAFPRFKDFYEQGGAGPGHPDIPDNQGETYRNLLDRAVKSGADAIQIATWNDWGEGTQIEPSVELKYRDLEATQALRKRIDPSFGYTAKDLEAPFQHWKRTHR